MARDEAYYQAEKKIEEALKSGATELDLSVKWTDEKSPQLYELPESIGQLVQLQSLNLSNNKLLVLPESLGNLVQLHSLNLSRNKVVIWPKSLSNLVKLENLNLHYQHQKLLFVISFLHMVMNNP